MFVEVIYLPTSDCIIRKKIPFTGGLTVKETIDLSQIACEYPEVKHLPVGIFSRLVSADHVLQPQDRVEIYRPLLIDPKEKRRQRADSSK